MSIEFEKMGLLVFLNSLSEEERKKFPDLDKIVDKNTFWNSSFFKKYKDIYEQKLEDQQDSGIAASDQACPNCKSKKTIGNKKQTRSSDEEISFFIYCTSCGKETRMS